MTTDAEKPAADGANIETKNLAPPNDLEQKIVSQIDFYFGDSNLPRDKFMLEQVKLDNGWIPMSTMLKFQRLSRLSSDVDVIVAAIKHSELVEVDTAGSEPKLRRSPEISLPELNAERQKLLRERTVYCKGFPLDADLDSVMAVVNEQGKPDNIYMRKYKDKVDQKYKFKGSIFATFKTVEEAKEFLDKPCKVGETDLIKMWQKDYAESKKKSEAKKKKIPEEPKPDENFKKGSTFHLSGEFEGVTRELIKEALGKIELEAAFVTFAKGEKEAFVRLHEENSAQAAVEKIGDGLIVNEAKLTARVLEGEEEEIYLKKANDEKVLYMNRRQLNKRGNRGGNRGGGRGRFAGKRRGGRGRNDEPPSKKVATD